MDKWREVGHGGTGTGPGHISQPDGRTVYSFAEATPSRRRPLPSRAPIARGIRARASRALRPGHRRSVTRGGDSGDSDGAGGEPPPPGDRRAVIEDTSREAAS